MANRTDARRQSAPILTPIGYLGADEHPGPGQHCDVTTGEYDPWMHFARSYGGRATLKFANLPGNIHGLTTFTRPQVVTLDPRLFANVARSTLAHEIVHVERGSVADVHQSLEEAVVELVAASRLVPIHELAALAERVDTDGEERAALALRVCPDTVRAAVTLLGAARAIERPTDAELVRDAGKAVRSS